MKVKFFAGKWDSWGIAVSACRWSKSLTINLIHWYFTVEFWTKKDIEIAEQNIAALRALIEKEEKKNKKKATKPKKSK